MKILTFRTAGGTRAGRLEGDDVVELDFADAGALLATGAGWRRQAEQADGRRHALADLELAPVVVAPRKIICLGLNYAAHIIELGRELPQYPTLFAKFARCLVGARDPIVLPTDQVDWEAELAFVIGSEVRHASREEAGAAIAGYSVCNDISVRDFQNRTLEWLQGKTFEHSTPLGPWLVTSDEVMADPAETPDLAIRCEVDGEVRQSSRTADLLFGPAAIVEYVSRIVTLEPGDVISTGTPGGVGIGRTPPVFLAPGQVVRTVVEGVGELVNECIAEK
ncbi:MAG TPA: fumarylacetoacetate hydrolase family protein [Acidimicrobiia bacterium]